MKLTRRSLLKKMGIGAAAIAMPLPAAAKEQERAEETVGEPAYEVPSGGLGYPYVRAFYPSTRTLGHVTATTCHIDVYGMPYPHNPSPAPEYELDDDHYEEYDWGYDDDNHLDRDDE